MGMIRAEIELGNPTKPDLKPLNVKALVDTRAMTPCIPEHVAVQLGLEAIETREVTTADERSHVVSYVGPLRIRFANRTCFTGALVIGETVLLMSKIVNFFTKLSDQRERTTANRAVARIWLAAQPPRVAWRRTHGGHGLGSLSGSRDHRGKPEEPQHPIGNCEVDDLNPEHGPCESILELGFIRIPAAGRNHSIGARFLGRRFPE